MTNEALPPRTKFIGKLEREGEHARFGFHDGALIAAQAPGAPRLGELLVEKGHIDAATLAAVMARQAIAAPRLVDHLPRLVDRGNVGVVRLAHLP